MSTAQELEQAFGVIDYAPYQAYLDGGKQDKELFKQFSENVMDVLPRSGSARIKNAPIMGYKDRVMGITKDFFALDLDVKNQFKFPNTGKNRGYIGYGDKKLEDIKEMFHIDRAVYEALKGTPYEDIDNLISAADMDKQMQVPELVKGFREVGIEFTEKAQEMGNAFFEVFTEYFELGAQEEQHMKKGNSVLRMIHYPPFEDTDFSDVPNKTRAQAHADISAMTFLLTSDQPGLQVAPKDAIFNTFGTTFVPKADFEKDLPADAWISVPASKEYCFMNIGRTLEFKSNGILPATIHRVIKMDEEGGNKGKVVSRYSAPFFQHIGWDMSLETWPKAVAMRGKDYFKQSGPHALTVEEYVLDPDKIKNEDGTETPIPYHQRKRSWIEPGLDRPVPVYKPS